MRNRRLVPSGLHAALLLSALATGGVASAFGCSASGGKPFANSGSGGAGGSGTESSGSTSSSGGSGGAGSTSTTGSQTVSASASTTGAGGAGGGTSSSAGGAGGGGGMGLDGGPPSDAGPPVNAEVYAHSPDTLYKLDPITKKVTTVGAFQGCSSVIDIALDKNGSMWGTTFSGLYTINKVTAVCTLISAGGYPNSLSFVPAGTLDPVNEALVGYNGSTYVRIDPATGVVTTVGSLGNGGYSSSGDMVSLIGGSSYLTVNGPNCNDCLVEVNPSTGALINKIGPLGHSSVFGLAYWAGVAYGFDAQGVLFQIDVMTAVTTVIPIPNAPPGLVFWGAGSTTAAPLHM
jgi:hypothetical protein